MKAMLDKIFDVKRARVHELKRIADVERMIEAAHIARSDQTSFRFRQAVADPSGINVIAEFKRASPSRGMIKDVSDPAKVAVDYERGGACAISVLTEEDHFKGSIEDLKVIRATTSLPILRKDFFFDEYQIYEAAAAGADAILLIVASLNSVEIERLRQVAEDELGLDTLVEVHTSDEMRVARDTGARLIGVNNRDLRTFDVSLDVSRKLVEQAPAEAVLVAESGLSSHAELLELKSLGYSGFLIGETLMRTDDPETALRELLVGNMEEAPGSL